MEFSVLVGCGGRKISETGEKINSQGKEKKQQQTQPIRNASPPGGLPYKSDRVIIVPFRE